MSRGPGTEGAPRATAPTPETRLRDGLAGVRGVLFDVDHTLVDTSAAFARALEAALLPRLGAARRPGQVAEEVLAEVAAQWGEDRAGSYRAFTRGEITYHDQRRRRVDEILTDRDVPALEDDGYEEFSRIFDAAFAASWEPFPDAVRAVRELAGAGLALGALTNAHRELQERKLAAIGLLEQVPVVVSVETFGVGKPDPRVFREGARALGLAPGETAYVGDEPDIDADAARAAGLVGVHLHRAGDTRFPPCSERQDGHLEVGDLTGLAAALALPPAAGSR